jgi:hypothetical protein
MLPAGLALAVAWAAGAGVVAACWNRRAPLPVLAWSALAGLLGPFAVGAALMTTGALGVPGRVSVPAITLGAGAAFAAGVRRRRTVLPRSTGTPVIVILALVTAIGWSGWVASRTHLGWDGTVVWYHKARILAASEGAMPSATLADQTRAWSAPDYPLHVPLAMAWTRLWQPIEDERAIKAVPAAWCAAILLLVAAAVLERSGSATRAACAVLVVASAPRLLIGEGSFTSGYGDGPLAGLLAALVWVVWRSDRAATRAWQPLLAILALALAWTKQEGAMAVLVAGAACAWRGRAVSRMSFAGPALVAAGAWQAWVAAHGAATHMAYEWPGAGQAVGRVGPIVSAYAAMFVDVRSWGLLWPGLGVLLVTQRNRLRSSPAAIVAVTAGISAIAFVWSDWPDVRAHLAVTVPRLGIGLVPALVVLALGADDTRAATLRQPQE